MARALTAEYVPNWASLIGAFEGVLHHLGRPADGDWLMGVTGHAFRIAASTGDEGFVDHGTWLRANYQRWLPLYANVGLDLRLIEADASMPDFAERKADALKVIRKSIDHGRPAIALGLHVPEFGIINANDERANTLRVSTISQEQTGRTLAMGTWPAAPERQLTVFLVGKERAVDFATALRACLAFACELAEVGEGPTFERVSASTHGFQAYERWIEALENQSELNQKAHAHNAQVVLSARQHAVRFLRRVAPETPLTKRLEAAADAYWKGMLEWSRFCTLFPYPGGGDIQGRAALTEGAGYLRRALVHERVAIEALREALTGWEQA